MSLVLETCRPSLKVANGFRSSTKAGIFDALFASFLGGGFTTGSHCRTQNLGGGRPVTLAFPNGDTYSMPVTGLRPVLIFGALITFPSAKIRDVVTAR